MLSSKRLLGVFCFVLLGIGVQPALAVDMEVICPPGSGGDLPEVRAGTPLDVTVRFTNEQCPFNRSGICVDASLVATDSCFGLGATACAASWDTSRGASCFVSGSACRTCDMQEEFQGLCTNTCRPESAGSATFNKLIVGLTGNANESLAGLAIFGPFKTDISGTVPAAECSGFDQRSPTVHDETVRVLDRVPAKLAGTTAMVFVQATTDSQGEPIGDSEKGRSQEYCKVSITAPSQHRR